MDKSKNKILYLEFIRIISILFVIYNHTGIYGFFMFSVRKPSTIMFWIYLFFSILCKFAVPVFFMISGILLLRKDYNMKQYITKIIRFLIIIFVFSLIYHLFDLHNNNLDFYLRVFLKKLITCNFSSHFWYLYMYLFLLLSHPFLRIISKELNSNLFNYLIVLVIILNGFVPTLTYALFKQQLSYCYLLTPLWCTNIIFLYPLLGYYIENKLDIKKKNLLYLWIVNISCIVFSMFMTYFGYRVTGILNEGSSQMFHNSFVCVNAVTIFITLKYFFEHIKINKILLFISNLGKYVFGIYILHLLMKRFPSYEIILDYVLDNNFNGILITLTICLYMFIYSFVITYVLSKIPIIKKLVGF